MSTDFPKPSAGVWLHGKHCFAIRVYIEDTDLGGVVYHANYLKFLERARSDLLWTLGIGQRAALESGVGVYAVAELQIQYCRPALLDDELLVTTEVEEIRAATCHVRQTITRSAETIAEARLRLAFINRAGRPTRQPAAWVEKFRAASPGLASRLAHLDPKPIQP